MALRGAWVISDSPEERKTIFSTLKKAYDLRSRIAHGVLNRSLTLDEMRLAHSIEDLLRKLMHNWLDAPEKFSPQALNDLTLGIPE